MISELFWLLAGAGRLFNQNGASARKCKIAVRCAGWIRTFAVLLDCSSLAVL